MQYYQLKQCTYSFKTLKVKHGIKHVLSVRTSAVNDKLMWYWCTLSEVGWRANVSPSDHPVSEYGFDVCISADGKRNTLHGGVFSLWFCLV